MVKMFLLITYAYSFVSDLLLGATTYRRQTTIVDSTGTTANSIAATAVRPTCIPTTVLSTFFLLLPATAPDYQPALHSIT